MRVVGCYHLSYICTCYMHRPAGGLIEMDSPLMHSLVYMLTFCKTVRHVMLITHGKLIHQLYGDRQ